jgi:HK97 gp10 family phage protein
MADLQTTIRGLREVKAAFQALPERMRTHLNEATETTLSEIVRHAKARIQASPSIDTRTLLNSIAYTLNKNNGRGRAGVSNGTTTINLGGVKVRLKGTLRVGRGGSALTSQGAKLMRPSRYAHLVEFGSRKMRAEPFMIPAAQSQENPYLDRCRRAGTEVEKDLAAIGLRGL